MVFQHRTCGNQCRQESKAVQDQVLRCSNIQGCLKRCDWWDGKKNQESITSWSVREEFRTETGA
jgi:hypothetical protein